MKHILFLSLMFLILCEDDSNDSVGCTEQFVYGLNITVKDANNNSALTDNITVIARDGEYEEQLMMIEESEIFIGAGERSGNYIIKVTATGYQDFISEVIHLDANECHVIPEALEILLEPN